MIKILNIVLDFVFPMTDAFTIECDLTNSDIPRLLKQLGEDVNET